MKETLSLTIKLFLICAIVTGLLAFVNAVTEPIILDNNQKNFEAAMAEVLPNAGTFEEIDISSFAPSKSGVIAESAYQSKSGGYVVSTICSEGYGGDISVMVGVYPDGSICQVQIMSMSETPGLGAKATNPEFTDQYKMLTEDISVIKNAKPEGNQIAAISGATVTSKAVTKAVNTALEAVTFIKGGN